MDKILYLSVTGTKIKATNTIDITSHSENWFKCSFAFDSTWTALEDKIAVFTNDKKTFASQQISTDNTCYIPATVLKVAGYLFIGVLHSGSDEKIPSEWTFVTIREGVDTGSAPAPPEQSVYVKILEETAEALEYAREVKDSADAGDFTASLAIGEVATSEPGSDAAVTNSGTEQHAIFDITIPRGEQGPIGTTGSTGPKGPPGLNWNGAYSAETGYIVDDVVYYNGSSYVCILDSTGNAPTNATYWSLLALKGSGDMLASVYDPNSVGADAFARGNHTGTQPASTISDFDTEVSSNTDVAASTTHITDITKHIPMVIALGSANTYTVTVSGITAYTDDQLLFVRFPTANTGASTLNVNDLGAKTIYTSLGSNILTNNAIGANYWYLLIYSSELNGFMLISLQKNIVDQYSTQTLYNKGLYSATLTNPYLSVSEKTTPVDADALPLTDSVASNVVKKVTWANVKTGLGDSFYTKTEVDNAIAAVVNDLDWKESVATYDDIATTYPSPVDGWTVNVNDTDITYRYDGSSWVPISANAIPMATASVDGKMSSSDFSKLAAISGTNTGNETTTSVGTLINGATAKDTPVDDDMVGLMDSAAGNVLKKFSWANIKATLKTYFDTVYAAASHNQAASTVTAGTLAGKVVANATATATYTDAQVRNITISTEDPSGGNPGDIWIKYTP